jgi:hypothetical protein
MPKRQKVTNSETGLPGLPMKGVVPMRPKASGLPGRIAMVHNSSVPTRSSAALMWSSSPTETPPLPTIRSACAAPLHQRLLGGCQGVLDDAQIDHLAAESLQQPEEHEAVGVVDLSGAERLARHHQLVAAGEDRDAQTPIDAEVRARRSRRPVQGAAGRDGCPRR